jgi:hypothetical protein
MNYKRKSWLLFILFGMLTLYPAIWGIFIQSRSFLIFNFILYIIFAVIFICLGVRLIKIYKEQIDKEEKKKEWLKKNINKEEINTEIKSYIFPIKEDIRNLRSSINKIENRVICKYHSWQEEYDWEPEDDDYGYETGFDKPVFYGYRCKKCGLFSETKEQTIYEELKKEIDKIKQDICKHAEYEYYKEENNG